MSTRPHSWYAAQHQHIHQAPVELPPLIPGAPDYPPTFALPDNQTQLASPSRRQHRHEQEGNAPSYTPQRQHRPGIDTHEASSSNITPYTNPQIAYDATPRVAHDQSRKIGHLSTQSQPNNIAHYHSNGNARESLSSPVDTTPIRPRSPKLGGQQVASTVPLSDGELNQCGQPPINRVQSPQPRRNTVTGRPPILTSNGDQTAFPQRSPIQAPLARRPLPPPPAGSGHSYQPQQAWSTQNAPSYGASPSISPSPSPHLSRSPSAASTSSSSSTGSMRRRPLPQPPGLPTVQDSTYSSHSFSSRRPASYSEAQAAAASEITRESPVFNNPYMQQFEQSEEPEHVRNMRQRVKAMSLRAKEVGTSASSPPTSVQHDETLPSKTKKISPVPAITVPTFSFDEPDSEPSSSAPAISIAVAPPSPSLKATSSEYFESQLEDEGVPLPSSSVPMATTTKAYALACPKCDRPVLYGRTVNAMGKRWHPDCFVCAQCETKLEHMEFFTKDGQPYCHVDYHELFSIRCNHCQTPIVDESYITIDDDELGKRTYHELHFFCANCGDPFIDPKDQAAKASGEAEVLAKPFTVHKGYPYCEACNLKLHRPKCNRCKKPIPGDILKALNKDWCEDCFVCHNCGKSFDDGTFVTHQGLPHCELCLKRILRAATL